MKFLTTLLAIGLLAFLAVPGASANANISKFIDSDSDLVGAPCKDPGSSTCDEASWYVAGIVGGSWCVNTGATCGPNDNSWAAVTVWGPGVFVCVNTYTGELLCKQRPPAAIFEDIAFPALS